MQKKEIEDMLISTGALQNGHFALTSGLHSPTYFQCAQLLQHPKLLEKCCQDIVDFYAEELDMINVVISPAIGGIVVGQEVGRLLGVRSIFAERRDGEMQLRRGFHLGKDDCALVVEDVVTTGGSLKEVIDIAEAAGTFIVGSACVVNRGGEVENLDVPLHAVYQTQAVTYSPENCPLCRRNAPLDKPGSRKG